MTESETAPALRSYVRASRQSAEHHSSAEDLVAYRSRKLEPEREQAVRDHLVACEECSELLLDLAELEDTGGLQDSVSEFEIEAAWKKQHEQLFPGRSRQRPRRWQFGGWVAAACLALVVGTLGLELRELRRSAARFYAEDPPRVIAAQQTVRSLDHELPVLEFEHGRPGVVLLLLRSDLPYQSFRAEFLSPNGRSLLTREGLSVSEDLLVLLVNPEILPPGKTRVVVSGLQDGQFALVEEYVLRVQHP